jgi:hypothetical protein
MHPAHQRPGHRVVEGRLLRHETHQPTPSVGSEPHEHEVEVADVVRREDRTTVVGQVLHALDRELEVHRAEQAQRSADHRLVQGFGHVKIFA